MENNPYASPGAEKAISPPARQRHIGLGTIALLLAIVSSVWLLVAVAHVRADRTNRIPAVTSEGPFAGHVSEITYAALGLSFVALLLSFANMDAGRRPVGSAMFAIAIALANLVITLVVVGSIYED